MCEAGEYLNWVLAAFLFSICVLSILTTIWVNCKEKLFIDESRQFLERGPNYNLHDQLEFAKMCANAVKDQVQAMK